MIERARYLSGLASGKRFTLVELLVMIALVCIVAALLLPALQNTVREARLVSCASNLRAQFVGIQIYSDDSNGHMPAPWPAQNTTQYLNDRTTSANSDSLSTRRGIGIGALISNGYLSGSSSVLCPGNAGVSDASMTSINNALRTGLFDSTIWTETTYRPNCVLSVYQRPVIYAGARSYWDWPNGVDFHARVGIASRLKGNLPGGIESTSINLRLESYKERHLRSPRAINACAFPDTQMPGRAPPHQGPMLNVLFADGVIARCPFSPYAIIFINSAIYDTYKDYLNRVHPDYKAPQ